MYITSIGCVLRDTQAFSDAVLTLEQCLSITVATYGESSWPTTEVFHQGGIVSKLRLKLFYAGSRSSY